MSNKQENLKEVLTAVLTKAWEDKTFKKQLVASPKEAIEKLTGKEFSLKNGMEMIVTDQTKPNTFYFNIPIKPKLEEMELTEEQLEMVAGGDATGGIKDLIIWVILKNGGVL